MLTRDEARRIAVNCEVAGVVAMSDELLQFIIVVGFGAHLTAFIVTRTRFRNQMIKRGAAHFDSETGKWGWEKPPKSRY
jgi:hypothetical protein